MHTEKGFSLIEALIAMAILGIIAVGLLSAIGSASRSNIIANEKTTAESLAKSQMDYVKNLAYDNSSATPTYAVIPTVPAGYTIVVSANELNSGLQEISVTVSHGTKVINSLTDYKVNR